MLFASLQCLPSQSNNVFKAFTDNLGLNLCKIANKNLIDFSVSYQIDINKIKQHMKGKNTQFG